MSKIQIWKRITTTRRHGNYHHRLYLICQRYKFESESQHRSPVIKFCAAVFNMSKIQIWKRITTRRLIDDWQRSLYLICQRYKFESESQQIHRVALCRFAVFNMSKIQIWKRITTIQEIIDKYSKLYLICQRYKFESESQPTGASEYKEESCI